MGDWDDVEIDQDAADPKPPREPRIWLLWAGLALFVIGIGAYFILSTWRSEPAPDTSEPELVEPPAVHQPAEEPTEPEIELPSLEESDALVRELVGKLSSHPKLASWLVTEDLISRFVQVVDNIAEGVSPRPHLSFLSPTESFEVARESGSVYVDSSSYDRYNLAADVFGSLDTAGSAKLYQTLEPLIKQAYRGLGYPDRNFDVTLSRAIDQLQETPVVEGPVELKEKIVSYQFADPGLEGLRPAQKHFLRMGPRNVRKVQAKLRELAQALGIS